MGTLFKIRGFTLIELMVTVLVLVTVMTVAIPSFQSIIQNNLSISLSNDLLASLYFARSEAIKRGASVSVCAAADQNFNSCGNNWNQGWIIFVNPAVSSNYSSSNAQQVLLRANNVSGNNSNITTTPTVNMATYDGSGFANPNTSNVTFSVNATGCTGNYARTLAISLTGRINVTHTGCP